VDFTSGANKVDILQFACPSLGRVFAQADLQDSSV